MSTRLICLLISCLLHVALFYAINDFSWLTVDEGKPVSRRVDIILAEPKREATTAAPTAAPSAEPMSPAPPAEAVKEQPQKPPRLSAKKAAIKPTPAPSEKPVPKQKVQETAVTENEIRKAETFPQIFDKTNIGQQNNPTNGTEQPAAATTGKIPAPRPHQVDETGRFELENEYKQALLQAIEQHKRYPASARRRGIEGEVELRFTVLQDGTITHITIEETSGWKNLDQAATKALERLQRFKPIPPALKRAHWEFLVTIRFSLK